LNDPEALAVRGVGKDRSDLTELTDQERWDLYSPWLAHKDPAARANAVLCLIHQANYLLDRQISALEKGFIEEGGYSEALATARLAERERQRRARVAPNDRSDKPDAKIKAEPPVRGGVTNGKGPAQAPSRTSAAKPAELIPTCPDCQRPMVLRIAKSGKNQGGRFWGCSGYPKCKGTVRV
jgi:four helix bundle suffix protein